MRRDDVDFDQLERDSLNVDCPSCAAAIGAPCVEYTHYVRVAAAHGWHALTWDQLWRHALEALKKGES